MDNDVMYVIGEKSEALIRINFIAKNLSPATVKSP